ncbi:N-formylglutamate deformylase [Asticcacaulis endophyticus]|uniref:N-formylglutamate deformylase n=1 Tax=Asticcacaulis endophyticus TaxID=1395890 RepID=A0A918Q7X8_9CAUL|nr:N-formylglutamate deformylase [Asticcacaulis endophyticus]GGZ36191.1 N-formylglutamate deformylase [Asticcacaulis endophyticus]
MDETTASADMAIFEHQPGDGPLVIAAPHVGTHLPEDIAVRMTPTGQSVGETDFHVHRLYDFARDLGASTLWATHSRYVIDLNRPPDGGALYPGKFETALCPLTDFDLQPLYIAGLEPDAAEVEHRRLQYHAPYHQRLTEILAATRVRHGYALLIDAHSIRSAIPSLFSGSLPDINLGSNDGQTLSPELLGMIRDWQETPSPFSSVLDGRFKGGYTTRHYGRPVINQFSLQTEIVQDRYLDTADPRTFHPELAMAMSMRLKSLVEALLSHLERSYRPG